MFVVVAEKFFRVWVIFFKQLTISLQSGGLHIRGQFLEPF